MTSPGHRPDELVSHYRLVRKLGAGGMGEVYLAEDTELGRPVAIKFLTETDDDPDAHKRLLREARAAAALDHPNICAVYEVSAHTDPPFIVMQYVEGETLAARLRRGPLSIDDALRLGVDLADALSAAHTQGIVHRDVKPQNVVLAPTGHAKLLDFGIARHRPPGVTAGSQQTQTLTHVGIVGTPAYMAPEQIQSGAVDGRTDLFALGAVLYESLTGVPPFSGQTQIEVFASILHAEPPAPSTIRPELTEAHDQLCARLLKKNPDDRPESASEVLTSLRELGATTRRTVIDQHVGRPGLKSLGLVAGALIVAVLATFWLVRKPTLSIEPAPQAAGWFDQGVKALQEGAYVQASRALTRAVELDPEYPLAWTRLAEAQLELDEEDSAKDSIIRAVNLVDRSRLPERERLAFEATIGMVQRDYDQAQRSYTTLLGRQPASAPLHLDLGRAYEADEAIEKAIEHYLRASQLDPENPAPFLRLGILYARQDKVDSALEAFDRAEELYVASSRTDGRAAVYYQRGVMYSWLDRVEEARAALTRAQALAESAESEYLRAAVMFRLSSLAGVQGDYREAEQLALKALEIGEGLDSLTAFGLVDLGNVFIYAGEHQRAAQYFEQARRRAAAAGARRAEARARLAIASLQIAEGKVGGAREHATAALRYYESAGFRGLRAVALTVLAAAQARSGELEDAQRTHEHVLALATERNAPTQIAEQHSQLAAVLLARERYGEALKHIDEAVARYRLLASPYYRAHAALLKAEVLWRLGDFPGSERELAGLFDQGSGTGPPTSELEQLRHLRRAGLKLAQNQWSETLRFATAGLRISTGSAASAVDVELQTLAAVAAMRAGDAARAWEHVERAASLANRLGDPPDPVLLSKVALARAEILLGRGQGEEALRLSKELGDRFTKETRFESAWLSYSVASRAAALSREDQARVLRERAMQARSALAATLSAEAWARLRQRGDLARYAAQ